MDDVVTSDTPVPPVEDPSFAENPYPTYRKLRQEAPISRVEWYGLPAWLVTRADDVLTVLGDRRFSIETRHASPDLPSVPWLAGVDVGLSKHLGTTDPPDHTRLRKLVAKVFTARRIETLRPKVQQIADELVTDMLAKGDVDLLTDFAYPLPVTVISEMLGVPENERADFKTWSNTLVSGTDPAEVMAAFGAIAGYITDLVTRKTDSPAESDFDLLTELIKVRDVDQKLDDEELRSLAFQLLTAGFETTSVLIGNGMLALLQNPDQLTLLRERPDLTAGAIEEFLRFDSPVDTGIPRYALEDVELGGTLIRAGDAVVFSLASGNRDLPVDGDPDHLDIRRAETRHLSFAHGIHFCLGAPLARMEGQIAFRTLLNRTSSITLAADAGDLSRKRSPFTRGLTRLPLKLTAIDSPDQMVRP